MPSIAKRWQTGKSVTGVAIIGQTLQADLTFTAGTSRSLTGLLERFGISFSNRTEEISPLDSDRDNQVIVLRSNSVTIQEIIQHGTQPWLESIAEGYDHASFTFTEFAKTKTYYGVILSSGEEKVKGKNVYSLELGPIEMSTGNNYSSA